MRRLSWLGLMVVGFFLALVGCGDRATETEWETRLSDKQGEEADIKASLGQLSPEDRKLAEKQSSCVVESENRLGSMGVPVKVLVKDEPVFLCCKSCRKKALADPDKTLAKARELRAKVAGAPDK